jgi:hypothetical protein
MELNLSGFISGGAVRSAPPRRSCVVGDWVSRTEIERNPVYRMPGMICYDAGRVASGDFYGDAQLTRIGLAATGVRLIAESPHYCHLVPCLSEPPYPNENHLFKAGAREIESSAIRLV